jgi:hypothetical protein
MDITYHPIGIIHSPFHEISGMPIQPSGEEAGGGNPGGNEAGRGRRVCGGLAESAEFS